MSEVIQLAGKASPKSSEIADPLLNVEMGVERLLPFSNWGSEGEVTRNEKVAIDDLVEMRRRDGQARAISRLFLLSIASAFADGKWIAEDGDDDADEEVQFANDMWNLPPQAGGMTTSKSVILKKLLQGITDGFAAFEEVRQVPEDGVLKGKITLRKLAYRDPRTLRFRVDETGGFNGIRQITQFNGQTVDVTIPKEKVFFWTCNAEENPFYGVSMFESAYEHYVIKKKLYYIAHLAAQFAAVPGRIGEVPANADPRQVMAFKKSLASFAFNTSMITPPGFKVTPFNGNSNFDFIKLIDHHNSMMSKSVLASFLDSEQRAALVEIGRVDPNSDFFILALESLMDDIAEQLSAHLMPKYIDWNFGTKKYPIFKFGQLSDASKGVVKDLFSTMVTSSVLNSTPEFVREMEKKLSAEMDLEIDYEKIEADEKKVAEEAAKAQEDEANALLAGGPEGEEPEEPADPEAGGIPDPDASPSVGLSASIDELVTAAAALFSERPPEGEEEV